MTKLLLLLAWATCAMALGAFLAVATDDTVADYCSRVFEEQSK